MFSCALPHFQELRALRVRTVWGNPASLDFTVGGLPFDVVIDNNGKDLDTCK